MSVIDDAAVGPFERVVHAEDPTDAGCGPIVAVHSTALGPGGRRHPVPPLRRARPAPPSTPCGSRRG